MFNPFLKFVILSATITTSITGLLIAARRQERNTAGSPPCARLTVAAVSAERKVTIDNFSFNPQVLTIAPGTRVTWVNRDDVPHTATSSDAPPKFNSKTLDTDQTFSFVFTR